MVSGLAIKNEQRHGEYIESVFIAYMRVIAFLNYPSPMNIYGEYCSMVDREVVNLQARIYPDEFYDGSPGRSSKRILPDSVIGNLGEHIGMPPDISLETIKEVLDDYQLFYIEDDYYNSPLKEVW